MDSSKILTPAPIYELGKASGTSTWAAPVCIYQVPCDCLVCAEQLRSPAEQQGNILHMYAGGMTGSEVTALSRQFCERLLADLQEIQSILGKHEQLIQKRWLKKSNTKRKAHLKQVRPNMHEGQNALMDTVNACPDGMSTRQYRELFLLPYMTVDTLSKDGTRLLRLLYYRAS